MEERGLTLVELVVTIAIVSLLIGLSSLFLFRFKENYKLLGAARVMQADLARARYAAIQANSLAVFQYENGSYLVFIDDGQGGAVAADWKHEGAERLLVQRELPSPVSLTSNFPGNHFRLGRRIRVRPGSLVLSDLSGRSVAIVMNVLGKTRIEERKD